MFSKIHEQIRYFSIMNLKSEFAFFQILLSMTLIYFLTSSSGIKFRFHDYFIQRWKSKCH